MLSLRYLLSVMIVLLLSRAKMTPKYFSSHLHSKFKSLHFFFNSLLLVITQDFFMLNKSPLFSNPVLILYNSFKPVSILLIIKAKSSIYIVRNFISTFSITKAQ